MTTITISEIAERSGVAASAIRFYEEQGLINSTRTEGGRRESRIFGQGSALQDYQHS